MLSTTADSRRSEQEHYDEAIADFDEAIQLDPKLMVARRNRGSAYENTQKYDKAIADYDEAIRLDHADPFTYVLRGGTWERLQEFGKAIADYEHAIALCDPRAADTLPQWSLAWILATCPDARFRDGARAVELAQKASRADTLEGCDASRRSRGGLRGARRL